MFHIEAAKGDPLALIRRIHETGMKAGIAVKPKTMIDSVLPFAGAVDMVLIMTVEPGFGGQKFMPQCLEKARSALHPCALMVLFRDLFLTSCVVLGDCLAREIPTS